MTSETLAKDHSVSFSLPLHANGILPDRMIAAMADSGLILPAYPFVESQIQPASLDLRLGDIAYRVRASFLPGPGATVSRSIRRRTSGPPNASSTNARVGRESVLTVVTVDGCWCTA